MANHFLAIDPVLLMDDEQLNALSELRTSGEAQDFIQKELNKEFDFGQVFQSTNNEHDLHVHEFMLANETGERKMHKMGVMKTPSDLVAFVTVDDDWMKENKDVVNKGVHFKMHERVDPKELKAVKGLTEDGQTTSAVRYGHYTTNVLMISENEKAISKDETAKGMEERAEEEEETLRQRVFSLDNLNKLSFLKGQHDSVKKETMGGAFVDGFMKGLALADNYESFKSRRSQQPSDTPSSDEPSDKEVDPDQLGDGLNDLSEQRLAEQRRQQEQL